MTQRPPRISRVVRIAILFSLFALPSSQSSSQTLSGVVICIDPGHGGYESDDRHVIPDPGTDFWESESNFYKAVHLKALLEEQGATVYLTRTGNADPVNDDPSLTARWQYANSVQADWFHSIHSNAAGGTNTSVNRTIVLIKENIATRQPAWPDAVTMASYMYNDIRAFLGTQSAVGNIQPGVYLDYTFYGGTNGGFNLGVLSGTNMPAELSEGSFHDYYPETRRLMNNSYRKLEAYALRNSLMRFFNVPADTLAVVKGVQVEEGTGRLINYSRVRLVSSDSVFVGDRFFNGFYMHDRLVPGPDTLIFETPGYVPDTVAFTAGTGAVVTVNAVLTPLGAPSFLEVYPANGDTTMPATASLTFRFTKVMDTASVRTAFSISPHVPGQLLWASSNTLLTFDPDSIVFPFNVWFTVTIDSNARSADGNALDGNGDGTPGDPLVLTFRPKAVDAWAPAVVNARPFEGDTLSSPLEILNVTFDEIIAPSSVNTQNIALQQVGSALQPLSFQTWTWKNRSGVNVYPTNGLRTGTAYRIRIYGIRDYAGNSIPTTETLLWNFAVSTQAYTRTVLEDFETGTSHWTDPRNDSASVGFKQDSTSLTSVQNILLPFSGNTTAAKLAYVWDAAAGSHALRMRPATELSPIVAGHARLQVHVWGDGSGNQVRFALRRTTPVQPAGIDVFSPSVTVSWIGWRLLEYPLDVDSLGNAIGDSADAGTTVLKGIELLYGGPGADLSGQIVLDDLQIAQKIITGVVQTGSEIPDMYELSPNYPNPFNPSTVIPFAVPVRGPVRLAVYDLLGREVALLLNDTVPAGTHQATFDASRLPSGPYIVELRAGGVVRTRKITLLK